MLYRYLPGVINSAKSGPALSIVGAMNMKDNRPMKINKTAAYPDVILTSWNRPTLPQCGTEGVVFYGILGFSVWSFTDCHLMTLNVNDGD